MIVRFINRKDELSVLERLYNEKRPQLVIVYGRRRVGKTRLLLEFLKGKNGLYFYVPRGGGETILSELSRVVEVDFFKGFKFKDFSSFLEYLVKRFEEKTVVIIDEFQRLCEVDGAISYIQKYWDEKFSKTNSMLILSGSSIGSIKKVAFQGDAPLYGRRTFSIKVSPLKFLEIREWFPNMSPENLVKIYAAFGGTPAYLEKVNEKISPEENILELILKKGSALYDEPEYLLLEELRVPTHYMDILTAISLGKCYLSEISDFTKIKRENLTTYLSSLELLELISREYPVLVQKKRSRYYIVDPFFEFWFKFVRPNKATLELGLEKNVWKNISEEFNSYLGKIFEKISKECIISKIKSGTLNVDADVIGRLQYDSEEIDLVAYSTKEDKGLLFEVKWKELSYEEAKRTITRLIEKSHFIRIGQKDYGLIVKKVLGKEKLRDEGFLAFDLDDLISN
ncbi:MAG: ATP-binding protein [Nitrososphaeria archaeon]|nr:ATP-binding protein [Nitrososphaeria archaeon]